MLRIYETGDDGVLRLSEKMKEFMKESVDAATDGEMRDDVTAIFETIISAPTEKKRVFLKLLIDSDCLAWNETEFTKTPKFTRDMVAMPAFDAAEFKDFEVA